MHGAQVEFSYIEEVESVHVLQKEGNTTQLL